MAAITLIPQDDGLLLVGFAVTASLAVARHRRAMERLSLCIKCSCWVLARGVDRSYRCAGLEVGKSTERIW